MRLIAVTVSAAVFLISLPVQAMSVTRDGICYRFRGAVQERREVCRVQEFDTSTELTWADGTRTNINWVFGLSEQPAIDEVPVTRYGRNPDTLRILEDPIDEDSVLCLQALESNVSVCWF